MSNSQSIDDLLGNAGPPAFKFENIGDTAKGVVQGASKQQVRNFKTGEPEVFNDGNPKMQLVVTLLQDDGELVRIFCKPSAEVAIREATQKAESKFEIGGRLAVRYSGDEPSKTPGMSPKKLFTAQWQAPAKAADVDDLL